MVDVPEKSERVEKLKNYQFEIFVKSPEEWERDLANYDDGKSKADTEWRSHHAPLDHTNNDEMNQTKKSHQTGAPDRSTLGMPAQHPFGQSSPNRSGSV